MNEVDLGQLLDQSGAILKGHFLLTSGRHSDTYFEKFRVLEQPHVLSELCARIAAYFAGRGIELVAGPTTGGIIIAFEVARRMGVSAVYVESEGGQRKVRRGAVIPPGSKVLVVDDVLTTGKSALEVADLIRRADAEVVGVGVLIDRSETPPDFGAELYAAYKVSATSYPADQVPADLAAIPLTKPGTSLQPA